MKWVVFASLMALAGCATAPQKAIENYQLSRSAHLVKQKNWLLDGRVVLASAKDSVSASINWRHSQDAEFIVLSGPLSQGKVELTVKADGVVINDGDKPQSYDGASDQILREQVGIDLPVTSLRYWVLGVGDPAQAYVESVDGFDQAGWKIRFKEMQQAGGEWLPKKITAESENTKIKLVVDQWDLL